MKLLSYHAPRPGWCRRLLLLSVIVHAGAGTVHAQESELAQVRAIAGCWAVTVAAVSPPLDLTGTGWARIPVMIQIDTVPGRGRDGGPLGWQVRSPAGVEPSLLGNAYLLVQGIDSLEIRWTNFHTVGVAVAVRVRGTVMEGIADPWTDAVTSNKAPVHLVRTGYLQVPTVCCGRG